MILSILLSMVLGASPVQKAPDIENTASQEMAYGVMDFSNLYDMKGFSKDALSLHFTLYQGYVKNTNISLTPAAQAYICTKGYDQVSGARIMDRLINEKIKKIIANEILFGKLTKGGQVVIDAQSDELQFTIGASSSQKQRKATTKDATA